MKPKPKTRRVWVYLVDDFGICPMADTVRSRLVKRRGVDVERYACGPIVSIDVPLPKRKKGETR